MVLSVCALTAPILGELFFSETWGGPGALVWLLGLVPAFLFSYFRGLRGAVAALSIGLLALVLTQITLQSNGRPIQNWSLLVGIVVAYAAVAVAVGWMSELLHEERRKAEQLATIDELTGLPNRRLARRVLEMEVAAAERGRDVTLVMFDLDNFKAYNDSYGHLAGDQVIAAMGRALQESTRRMNLSARWGGEEFIAILSETGREGALRFVNQVRANLQVAPLEGEPVTFSAGIACYGPGLGSVDALLDAADRALYRAKIGGRNRAAVVTPPASDQTAD
ncbi:MAG: diguanylate cyclase [Gemmatimonadota bacterium]|jgi:diguanylate cyclase (GGDEF)-like protein|nr:diguanylate cyclase [Gemmatimonadota bacterium]